MMHSSQEPRTGGREGAAANVPKIGFASGTVTEDKRDLTAAG